MSALYSCLKGKNDPIMTASTADRVQNLEAEEAHEECAATGKKKSKFKTFKKFFVKKKDRRKELPVPSSENILKPSQSSGDVCVSGASSNVLHPENDPRAKGYMGNKALSHDSVFMAESENTTKEHSSCENIPGRVKALQMQLQQNIRVGSSPQIITRKKIEDTGALSEDDGLPRSPPEISTLHEILSHSSDKPSKAAQRRSSLSLGGTDSEGEQVSSRPHSLLHCNIRSHPTTPATFLLPKDFSSPASPLGCLDNSAAKHRIAVKPKKQKGPAVKRKLIAGEESKVAQQDQCEDTQQDQCEDTPQDQCHEAPQDQCDDTQQDQYEDTQQDQYEDTQQDQYEDTPQDQSKGAHEDQYEGTWNDQCGDTQEDQPEGAQKGQPLETHMTHSLKPADEMEVTNRENTRNEENLVQSSELDVELFYAETKMGEITENKEHCDDVSFPCVDLIPQQEPNQLQDGPSSSETDVDFESDLFKKDHTECCHQRNENQDYISQCRKLSDTQTQNVVVVTDHAKVNPGLVNTEENVNNDLKCSSKIYSESPMEAELTSFVESILSDSKDEVQIAGTDVDTALTGIENDKKVILKSSLTVNDMSSPFAEFQTVSLVTDVCEGNTAKEASPTFTKCGSLNIATDRSGAMARVETEIFLSRVTTEEKLIGDNETIFSISRPESFQLKSEQLSLDITDDINKMNEPSAETRGENLSEYPEIEVVKADNLNDTHLESLCKTSSKPVKFTVAPAWQRSLSGGSTVKDSRNIIVHTIKSDTMKSELFVGTEGLQDSCCSEDSVKEDITATNITTKDESAVPFGIRLRRTTSSNKYNEEEQYSEPMTQTTCVSETVSIVLNQNVQTCAKTTDNYLDMTNIAKPSQASEDKFNQISKSEDVQNRHNSEPAWISMAKQKQKGFQDHVLAREQNMGTEKEVKAIVENPGRRNTPECPEMKGHTQKISMEVADAEVQTRMDLEKSTSSAASHSPNEPTWLSLAKKKAKAWSEMPPIVQ